MEPWAQDVYHEDEWNEVIEKHEIPEEVEIMAGQRSSRVGLRQRLG